MGKVKKWSRIVALRDQGGLSFAAIGLKLGLPETSVRSMYYRHRTPSARAATLASYRRSSRAYREKRTGGAA